MLRVINTCDKISDLFENGSFDIDKWQVYMNDIYKDSAKMFLNDMNEYVDSGKFTYKETFLPIINEVYNNPKLDILLESFTTVTKDLNQRVIDRFGKELNIDIVLYLGLCNAAGWVTDINGSETVLLGIEKIIELSWYDLNAMYGLIYHELGHVYHMQHGLYTEDIEDVRQSFIWQLYSEGVAMHFEQVIADNMDLYHQDKDGWKNWCEDNYYKILRDFDKDLESMNRQNQRYFGDWCSYFGKGDVGYYLGVRFIRFILAVYSFDEMISLPIEKVIELYTSFKESELL